MLDELYRRTKSYLENDKFVVTLGGEHSISYAPISAHAEHFGSLTVLQSMRILTCRMPMK